MITLTRYFFTRSLIHNSLMWLGLAVFIYWMDVIELLRRLDQDSPARFIDVMMMAACKLPFVAEQVLPFAVLFGSMIVLWRLARNQELVVARSAGISAWQFLWPIVASAITLGLLSLLVINPLSSVLLSRYELLESRYIHGQNSLLSLTDAGLWLRQPTHNGGYAMVHAMSFNSTTQKLSDVMVLDYSASHRFISRMDAREAELADDEWILRDVWVSQVERPPVRVEQVVIPTDLTLSTIQDSFAPPQTISIWELPQFIITLKEAGFSALRHQLHLLNLLASPLLLIGMVIVAAVSTLRLSKRNQSSHLIIAAVLLGFVFYFTRDFVNAYGISGQLPLLLAAFSPAMIANLLGLTVLLYLEDG